MRTSSQQYDLDNRLLATEELLRQLKYDVAARELEGLTEREFDVRSPEYGLLLALKAEVL